MPNTATSAQAWSTSSPKNPRGISDPQKAVTIPRAKSILAPIFTPKKTGGMSGRFQSMTPTEDRNGDGSPDFIGWNQELANRTAGGKQWLSGVAGKDPITTVEQAKGIWDWQHRSYDGNDPYAEGPFNANPEDRDFDYLWGCHGRRPHFEGQNWVHRVQPQRAHGLSL